MKLSPLLCVLALAATSSLAQASPRALGTGPGTYTFAAGHDNAFFVTLAPGTYSLAGVVTSSGFDLGSVWFSYGKDPKSSNGNDLGLFSAISAAEFDGGLQTLTLTESTNIYVDVNTRLGKLTDGQFQGTLTITAVPEAPTMALFVAGLGLLGFMAKRRPM